MAIWEKKLIGGVDLKVVYIDLGDDATCKKVGYSFILDFRNTSFRVCMHLVHAVAEEKGDFVDF